MRGIIIDVTVDPSREEQARRMLHDVIVPKAKTHQGFVTGYWLRARHGDLLRSIHLYDSDSAAQAAAEAIHREVPHRVHPVTLKSVDTYEVLAQA